jgi:hypothetical protein
MRRPDRVGYVIDVMPDFVALKNELSGEIQNLPVLQVWVDPARPDEWRKDPAFKPYVARLGIEEGMSAIIRNGSEDAIFLAPPSINEGGTWFEHVSGVGGPAHRPEDYTAAGFNMKVVLGE